MNNSIPVEPQDCPVQMPVSYFGANYQDSQCIDGYLWDLDSGDGEYLFSGGDIPCPFCKPVEHLQYQLNDDEFNAALEQLNAGAIDKAYILDGYTLTDAQRVAVEAQ